MSRALHQTGGAAAVARQPVAIIAFLACFGNQI